MSEHTPSSRKIAPGSQIDSHTEGVGDMSNALAAVGARAEHLRRILSGETVDPAICLDAAHDALEAAEMAVAEGRAESLEDVRAKLELLLHHLGGDGVYETAAKTAIEGIDRIMRAG